MTHNLAAAGYPPSKRTNQSAKRINLVTFIIIKQRAGNRFKSFNFKPGIGNGRAIALLLKPQLRCGVMLIFNFTNNFFNQIFDRDQTINPAKFINNQRQMAAAQTHFMKQIKKPDCWRYKQGRPQKTLNFWRVAIAKMSK